MKLINKIAIFVAIMLLLSASYNIVLMAIGLGDSNEHAQWASIFLIIVLILAPQIKE